MNDDEKFKQRWEVRTKDDADSSSDDGGGGNGGGRRSKSTDRNKVADKQHKFCTDLIVLNDSDYANGVVAEVPEKEIKKTKPSRKKSDSAEKKSIESKDSAKARKTKKKKKETALPKPKKKAHVEKTGGKKRKASPTELSAFCDSVISDLLVARVNMFATMIEEMEKLAYFGPCEEQKKRTAVKRCQKAKRGTEAPRRQFKKRKVETDDGLSVTDNNNLKLQTEINAFRCVFPSFAEISGKGVNFIGPNSLLQMGSHGIGFRAPIRQILENASPISENSVKEKSSGGPRLELTVGSEHVLLQTE